MKVRLVGDHELGRTSFQSTCQCPVSVLIAGPFSQAFICEMNSLLGRKAGERQGE